MRQEPTVTAVSTSKGELILPRNSTCKTLLHSRADTFDVVGMMEFLPPPALHLFKGGPSIVMPTFVEPISPACRVSGPGELIHVVGELAEARLALSQRLLSCG